MYIHISIIYTYVYINFHFKRTRYTSHNNDNNNYNSYNNYNNDNNLVDNYI